MLIAIVGDPSTHSILRSNSRDVTTRTRRWSSNLPSIPPITSGGQCTRPAVSVLHLETLLLSIVITIVVCSATPGSSGQEKTPRPTTTFSVAVSPTVVASIARTEDRLLLLALWRGATRWYVSSSERRASGGVGANGAIRASLQYGNISASLLLDPTAQIATIQDRKISVPPQANVLLIDGVGPEGRGQLQKAFHLDPGDANTDIRRGSLAPLLGRSPEVVEFLQCDAHRDLIGPADPCAVLRRK